MAASRYRTASRDRYHRRAHRLAVAGRAVGSRGCSTHAMHKQLETARPGSHELRVRQWHASLRVHMGDPRLRWTDQARLECLRPDPAVHRGPSTFNAGNFALSLESMRKPPLLPSVLASFGVPATPPFRPAHAARLCLQSPGRELLPTVLHQLWRQPGDSGTSTSSITTTLGTVCRRLCGPQGEYEWRDLHVIECSASRNHRRHEQHHAFRRALSRSHGVEPHTDVLSMVELELLYRHLDLYLLPGQQRHTSVSSTTRPDQYFQIVASYHPGGANVGFCDGSVKFLKSTVQSLLFTINRSTYYNGYVLYNNSTNTYTIGPGTPPGILQALSST